MPSVHWSGKLNADLATREDGLTEGRGISLSNM